MKDLNLLVFVTQFGFSVVFPLAGFVLAAVWLREKLGWGVWVIWVGLILGMICAIEGFRGSLRVMKRFAESKKDQDPPPVCFNDHD